MTHYEEIIRREVSRMSKAHAERYLKSELEFTASCLAHAEKRAFEWDFKNPSHNADVDYYKERRRIIRDLLKEI